MIDYNQIIKIVGPINKYNKTSYLNSAIIIYIKININLILRNIT